MSQSTERVRFVRLIPWVRELREPLPRCEGYRWSQMSLKASRDPELRERYRCKNLARWHFTALRRLPRYSFPCRDGSYCWPHLFSLGLTGSMDEEARVNRWLARHPNVHLGHLAAGDDVEASRG